MELSFLATSWHKHHMVAQVQTVSFQGVEVRSVDVQVQIASGLPAFTIVGLPDKAVAESKERVRSALHTRGYRCRPSVSL